MSAATLAELRGRGYVVAVEEVIISALQGCARAYETPYLRGSLFPGLPRVAPYCARGGVSSGMVVECATKSCGEYHVLRAILMLRPCSPTAGFLLPAKPRQPPRSRTARWSRAARRRTDRSIRQSRLGRSDQGSHGGPRSRCSTAAASAGSDYPQSLARRRSEGVSPSALCSSLTTRHKIPPSVADGAERPPRKTRGTGSEACAYPQKHVVLR